MYSTEYDVVQNAERLALTPPNRLHNVMRQFVSGFESIHQCDRANIPDPDLTTKTVSYHDGGNIPSYSVRPGLISKVINLRYT